MKIIQENVKSVMKDPVRFHKQNILPIKYKTPRITLMHSWRTGGHSSWLKFIR